MSDDNKKAKDIIRALVAVINNDPNYCKHCTLMEAELFIGEPDSPTRKKEDYCGVCVRFKRDTTALVPLGIQWPGNCKKNMPPVVVEGPRVFEGDWCKDFERRAEDA